MALAQGTVSQQRQSEPSAANSQLGHAQDYFKKNSRNGYMSPDQAMAYRGADGQSLMTKDGKGMDMGMMDGNGDRRISESEWMEHRRMMVGSGMTGGGMHGGTSGTHR